MKTGVILSYPIKGTRSKSDRRRVSGQMGYIKSLMGNHTKYLRI